MHIGINTGYIEFKNNENGWTREHLTFLLNSFETLSFCKSIQFISGKGADAKTYPLLNKGHVLELLLQQPDARAFQEQASAENGSIIELTVGGNGSYIIVNISRNSDSFSLHVHTKGTSFS